MLFSIDHLNALLGQSLGAKRIWAAYSGGVDSHVLLHHIQKIEGLNAEFAGAIHINHHLNPAAEDWQQHCIEQCNEYGIDCQILHVDATVKSGESPENAARLARYQAIATLIAPGDAVLLAHHQNDQAETFLHQAIRGSGPHGLSSMPAIKPFHSGYLLRPMLENTREEILAYAQEQQLQWIEDPSNQDTQLDRNFLRQTILPQLRQRWPAVDRTLARAARHTATQTAELDRLMAEQLTPLQGSRANTLSIDQLKRLSDSRAALLIRAQLRQLGLAMPSSQQLDELLGRQLQAEADRQILLSWADVEVRRYRDDLYFMPALMLTEDRPWQHPWLITETCHVPECGGVLSARAVTGQGLAKKHCDQPLTVKARTGGEKFRPEKRQHQHDLKKLYQESGIPPWERVRLPLIYVGGELAAVADLWMSHAFAASDNEPGYQIHWQERLA